MGRKCSHCGKEGHNSRTCTSNRGTFAGGLKLFGVQLDLSSSSVVMKRSFSMDCLYSSSPSSLSSPPSSLSSSRISTDENSDKTRIGYLSDGLTARVRPQERKKGQFLMNSYLYSIVLNFFQQHQKYSYNKAENSVFHYVTNKYAFLWIFRSSMDRRGAPNVSNRAREAREG